jgi:predicted SprT family Zn-dependent metalloprotease
MDGHSFLESKKTFSALLQIDSVRNTQLYRTLIHEFGHYKQYLELVERAGHEDEDFEEWNKRNEKYFKISSSDKESYAHKYADELINKPRKENIVPFDRISDIDSEEKMAIKKVANKIGYLS